MRRNTPRPCSRSTVAKDPDFAVAPGTKPTAINLNGRSIISLHIMSSKYLRLLSPLPIDADAVWRDETEELSL